MPFLVDLSIKWGFSIAMLVNQRVQSAIPTHCHAAEVRCSHSLLAHSHQRSASRARWQLLCNWEWSACRMLQSCHRLYTVILCIYIYMYVYTTIYQICTKIHCILPHVPQKKSPWQKGYQVCGKCLEAGQNCKMTSSCCVLKLEGPRYPWQPNDAFRIRAKTRLCCGRHQWSFAIPEQLRCSDTAGTALITSEPPCQDSHVSSSHQPSSPTRASLSWRGLAQVLKTMRAWQD